MAADGVFVRRVMWLLLLLALAWLVVQVSQLLLLVFGAVLVAVIFRELADPIGRLTRLPERWALFIAVLFVLSVIVIASWLFGAQVRAQVKELQETLPRSWRTFEEWLGDSALGERLLEAARDACRVALASAGGALRLWLRAQFVGMAVVGGLTTLGLWLIGLPSVLALGLLAALANFVPMVGPIVASSPALLIALTLGTDKVLWTLGLYLLIQQIEGNVIMPIVTRHAVDLPPALALFAIVALGLLFGPLGVLLGAPLTVALFVLTQELDVRRLLSEPAPATTAED